MKVVLTERAYGCIKEIENYIAQDNPRAAFEFAQKLFEKAYSLQDFPKRGRVVPKIGL